MSIPLTFPRPDHLDYWSKLDQLLCFVSRLGLIMEWLLLDGPLLASGLPGKFTLHIRIEALKDRKALWIIVVKPASEVEPIPIVAGVHRTELHVKIANDLHIALAGLEFLSSFYAISNGIDHAVAKIRELVENDDFRMFVVVEKAGRVGPEITFLVCPRRHSLRASRARR